MFTFFTTSERERTATEIREAIALLKAERDETGNEDLNFAIMDLYDDLKECERTSITVMFDDGFADTRGYN